MRWTFRVSAALVVAFLASLILRTTGSHYAPVDGWGVALFELAMGAVTDNEGLVTVRLTVVTPPAAAGPSASGRR